MKKTTKQFLAIAVTLLMVFQLTYQNYAVNAGGDANLSQGQEMLQQTPDVQSTPPQSTAPDENQTQKSAENPNIGATPDAGTTPDTSPSPVVSPTPDTSTSPAVSPTPDTSTSPAVSPTPDTSTSPAVSPTPDTSTSPVVSPTPDTSTSPVVSPTPDTSTSPAISPTPDTSTSPDVSTSPIISPIPQLKKSTRAIATDIVIQFDAVSPNATIDYANSTKFTRISDTVAQITLEEYDSVPAPALIDTPDDNLAFTGWFLDLDGNGVFDSETEDFLTELNGYLSQYGDGYIALSSYNDKSFVALYEEDADNNGIADSQEITITFDTTDANIATIDYLESIGFTQVSPTVATIVVRHGTMVKGPTLIENADSSKIFTGSWTIEGEEAIYSPDRDGYLVNYRAERAFYAYENTTFKAVYTDAITITYDATAPNGEIDYTDSKSNQLTYVSDSVATLKARFGDDVYAMEVIDNPNDNKSFVNAWYIDYDGNGEYNYNEDQLFEVNWDGRLIDFVSEDYYEADTDVTFKALFTDDVFIIFDAINDQTTALEGDRGTIDIETTEKYSPYFEMVEGSFNSKVKYYVSLDLYGPDTPAVVDYQYDLFEFIGRWYIDSNNNGVFDADTEVSFRTGEMGGLIVSGDGSYTFKNGDVLTAIYEEKEGLTIKFDPLNPLGTIDLENSKLTDPRFGLQDSLAQITLSTEESIPAPTVIDTPNDDKVYTGSWFIDTDGDGILDAGEESYAVDPNTGFLNLREDSLTNNQVLKAHYLDDLNNDGIPDEADEHSFIFRYSLKEHSEEIDNSYEPIVDINDITSNLPKDLESVLKYETSKTFEDLLDGYDYFTGWNVYYLDYNGNKEYIKNASGDTLFSNEELKALEVSAKYPQTEHLDETGTIGISTTVYVEGNISQFNLEYYFYEEFLNYLLDSGVDVVEPLEILKDSSGLYADILYTDFEFIDQVDSVLASFFTKDYSQIATEFGITEQEARELTEDIKKNYTKVNGYKFFYINNEGDKEYLTDSEGEVVILPKNSALKVYAKYPQLATAVGGPYWDEVEYQVSQYTVYLEADFEELKYTVTIDKDGKDTPGDDDEDTKIEVKPDETIDKQTGITTPGKGEPDGYTTLPGGEGDEFNFDDPATEDDEGTKVDKDIEVYPYWLHKVVFDKDGQVDSEGNINNGSVDVKDNILDGTGITKTEKEANIIIPDGKKFIGWVDEDGNPFAFDDPETAGVNEGTLVEKDMILYPAFSDIEFTITIDKDGKDTPGDDDEDTKVVVKEGESADEQTDVTTPGKGEPDGYTTLPDGKGDEFYFDDPDTDEDEGTKVDKDIEVYPYWYWTVIFEDLDKDVTDSTTLGKIEKVLDSHTINRLENDEFLLNIPAGEVFIAWSTNKDDDPNALTDAWKFGEEGTKVTGTLNTAGKREIVLYPITREVVEGVEHLVEFDSDADGDIETDERKENVADGATVTKPDDPQKGTPDKWVDENGDTFYFDDPTSTENTGTKVTKPTKLYPVYTWDITFNEYVSSTADPKGKTNTGIKDMTVIYVDNTGGTHPTFDGDVTVDRDLIIQNPTKPDYTFTGYIESVNGDGTTVLTATWKKVSTSTGGGGTSTETSTPTPSPTPTVSSSPSPTGSPLPTQTPPLESTTAPLSTQTPQPTQTPAPGDIILPGGGTPPDKVEVGGNEVGEDDYTVDENGKLTLTPEFIQTLPDGEHEIVIEVQGEVYTTSIVVENGVPLSASPLIRQAWSLYDLIMTILSALLLLIFIVNKGKKEDEEDEEYQERNKEENKENQRKRSIAIFILMVSAIFNIFLLFYTQDFSLPMAIFDRWSVAFTVVTLFSALTMLLFRKKQEEKDENDYYQA